MKYEKERSFGGKTEGFENKEEQRKEQRHLKAYLAGKGEFISGYEIDPDGKRIPIKEKVKEGWK